MGLTPVAMEVLPRVRKNIDKAAPILEGDQYPKTWGAYIGQEPAKRMLQVAARSARLRKEPLEHVLIAHPTAGVGKTALAALIAREMRRPCRVVSGSLSKNAARMLLSEMNDCDLLLYDEIHRIVEGGKKQADWMLHLLQDGCLIGPTGPEDQPKVTIIGTTTEAMRLPRTLVSRFLVPPMQDYTQEEATRIALLASKQILVPEGLPALGRKQADLVASAADKNPRAIRRLVITLRDMAITKELPMNGTRYDIDAFLAWQGITPDGLDRVAQRYLAVLAAEFDGSAGAKALEDRLQQPGGLDAVERVLMDRGLVTKTRGGRMLTQAGIARYQELTA